MQGDHFTVQGHDKICSISSYTVVLSCNKNVILCSTEAVEDPFDQQTATIEKCEDRKLSPTSAGAESVSSECSSIHVTADETIPDHLSEDTMKAAAADPVDGPQNLPDLSEQTQSLTSSSEPAKMIDCEMNEECSEVTDHVQVTLGYQEELKKQHEQLYPAAPDVDNENIISKHSKTFLSASDVQKGDSSPIRNVKHSGRDTDTPSQKDPDLQKINLKLAAENLELKFQLEQNIIDLPRLQGEVTFLKEECRALEVEKAELEKKLAHIKDQAGNSGNTVPELERTIMRMTKVLERAQKENEILKKSSSAANQGNITSLKQENEKFKADFEKLKSQREAEMNSKLENKIKGLEKIAMEHERLRIDIKREVEVSERLRVTNKSLEVTIEKLEAELEETKQKLHAALSRNITQATDSKTWKASVVTRMYENKMKELEKELAMKTSSVFELKEQLKEVIDREERAQKHIRQLEDQVERLKSFSTAANTGARLRKGTQANR